MNQPNDPINAVVEVQILPCTSTNTQAVPTTPGALGTPPTAPEPMQVGTVSESNTRGMLAVLPPTLDYDTWLRMASAVWSAHGEVRGTALLKEKYPEQEEGEYAAKYPHRLTKIGIGTLRFMAAEHGWKPSTDDLAFDGTSYWRKEANGNFGRLGREDVSLELRRRGASPKKSPGCEVSPLDEALHHIQTNHRVDYAAPFCGREAGLHVENGITVLATNSPTIIDAKAGDVGPLVTFFQNLYGRAAGDPLWQVVFFTFLAWVQRFRFALRHPDQHLPGQLFALVGGADVGKTLAQTCITKMFGGRQADPGLWLSGDSTFNGGLWGSEHWAASDSNIADTVAARKMVRDRIKEATANESLGCHRKNRDEITLRPIARLTLSANDDGDSTFVLPVLDESIKDKVIYAKCYAPPVPFPTQTEAGARAFFKSLTDAIPAFLHLVETFEVPQAMRKGRFGVKEFHHPDIVEMLVGANSDSDLANVISDWLDARGEDFTGTAVQLDALLELNVTMDKTYRRLCTTATKLGQALGRLSRADGWKGRVVGVPVRLQPNNQKQTRWTILRVLPAAG